MRQIGVSEFMANILFHLDDGDEGIAAYVEPFVILLILVINGIVAIWQDSNADSALEALEEMQAQESLTLRDGKWQTLNAKDLVPGDIVKVTSGQCVPADMRVAEIQSIALQAEQAALTGESVSVLKTINSMDENAKMLQDQKNMLFSSTIISSGTAIGVVAYTGMKTAIGSVHSEVQAAKEDEEDTPLKQKIDQFGDMLAKVIFAICFLVWAMNYTKFYDPIHGSAFKGCIYYFKIAVALAVAAIPEGLPAVITTCLALGTRKMAANNCIVRRLQSVETLGCTTVICSDKTGTLTKNEMVAVKFAVLGNKPGEWQEFGIEEKSYSPEDCKINDGYSSEIFSSNHIYKLMALVCGVNNRAQIFYDNGFKRRGEPTEAALKVFAEKLGRYDVTNPVSDQKRFPMGYSENLMQGIQTVCTLEFSAERKCMSTVVKGYLGKQNNQVLMKGAPEMVLDKCSKTLSKEGEHPMDDKRREDLKAHIKRVAGQGYRVLGIAAGLDGGNMKDITTENSHKLLADTSSYKERESGLAFIGYVCIKDPCREEVKPSI